MSRQFESFANSVLTLMLGMYMEIHRFATQPITVIWQKLKTKYHKTKFSDFVLIIAIQIMPTSFEPLLNLGPKLTLNRPMKKHRFKSLFCMVIVQFMNSKTK